MNLPPAATSAGGTPTPHIVEVPVEVTRLVVTERIVPATPTPPEPCTTEALDAAETVTVAALLPLAEPGSLQDALGIQTALILATDAINHAGGIAGRPLRLWLADSGGTVEQARAAAFYGIAQECAVAIVSAAGGEVARAELEAAHLYGVPYLLLDAPDDALTAGGEPEVFRLVANSSLYYDNLATWAAAVGDYNSDGETSMAFVVEDSELGHAQAQRIGAAIEQQGVNFVHFPVTLPSEDFSSLIARLVMREKMPDALFLRINGEAALDLQRQLAENGIGPQKKTLLVTMRGALDDAAFWPLMGAQGVSTVVSRTGAWPASVSERGAAFAEAFARYLNRWPEAEAFAAYDSLFLLADAVERAQSLDGPALVNALEQCDLALAAGHYRFPYGSHAPPEASGQAAWAWHQWMDPPLLLLQYTEVDQPAAAMAVVWPPSYATVDQPVVRVTMP